MDQIILLQANGKPGNKISLQKYEALKEAIVEVFLFSSTATEQQISEKVSQSIGAKFNENISSNIAIILPDLIAKSYVEKVKASDPALYQLKYIVC